MHRLRPAFVCLIALTGLAVLACSVKYEDIGLRDAGWHTYRNTDFGYEFSYPRQWELQTREPRPDDDFETQWARASGVSQHSEGPPTSESVLVAVNFQGGWCSGAGRVDTRDIVAGGVPGREYECYNASPACQPQPNCFSQPYGIARLFEGVNGKQNYLVLGDPTSDPLLVRRIIESFRFLPQPTPQPEQPQAP